MKFYNQFFYKWLSNLLRFHKMFTICKFIIVNVESVVQCC